MRHGGAQVALDVAEAERELARVEHLDGEAPADLHLPGVVGGVGAEATGGRPVAHRVGAVSLDDVLGRLGVALGLAHLLAVGVEDPAADRGVAPRHRAVLVVRAHDRGEEPGADDVVGLRAQVHRGRSPRTAFASDRCPLPSRTGQPAAICGDSDDVAHVSMMSGSATKPPAWPRCDSS